MSDEDRYLVIPDATMSTFNGHRGPTDERGAYIIPCVLAIKVDAEFWHRYVTAMQADHARHWGAA